MNIVEPKREKKNDWEWKKNLKKAKKNTRENNNEMTPIQIQKKSYIKENGKSMEQITIESI